MYYFQNLDDTTRFIMITELEMDLKNSLFYVPKSIKPDFVCAYKRMLRNAFEKGDVNSLRRNLIPNFFKEKDKNGKKISSNIREMLAFSDFNRYYMRAILLRAIDERKSVIVYRAKCSVSERVDSKTLINQSFSIKSTLTQMLNILRNYKILFNEQNTLLFCKPNSGLSLKLG